ncbi:thiopeptide-type bacteriocin biosynthesis protein [Nocardia sp. NPDC058480]|uniref:thiopeptide-type bacteriocin biosynthesis protein n=1 Tax=unclassified Nocardia TaxID=2637762 RepID=UPI0036543CC6
MRDPEQSAPAVASSPWDSVHVFFHGDHDRLLTEFVAPLVDDLTAEHAIEGWFFLRYWEGGPHIRLRLLPASNAAGDLLRTTVTQRAESYLRAHPSDSSWTDAFYRRTAEFLARQEGMASHFDHLSPNNSVAWIPYEREFHRYGRGSAIEAVERHFCDSSGLAVDVIRAGTTKPQRLTTCFIAVVLAWLSAPAATDRAPDRLGPLAAIVPHAEAHFADRYAEQRPQFIDLAGRLEAQARSSVSEPMLEPWWSSITRLRGDYERISRTAPDTLPYADRPGSTEFEQTTLLPTLDLCAHLFCNRLGLAMHEETFVRYLAAHALADARADVRGGVVT